LLNSAAGSELGAHAEEELMLRKVFALVAIAAVIALAGCGCKRACNSCGETVTPTTYSSIDSSGTHYVAPVNYGQ
jgi:hypothetical protein